MQSHEGNETFEVKKDFGRKLKSYKKISIFYISKYWKIYNMGGRVF